MIVLRHHPHPARGLTLIELLMALVIGTMIVAATAGLFSTTLAGWERGSRDYAVMQTAEKVGGLIERHLRSALPPGQGDESVVFTGEDLSTADGEAGHRLTLRSAAPGRFPRNVPMSDSCEICFEYDPLLTDGLTMRIQSPPDDLPDEGGYIVGLSPLVKGFSVRYYDGLSWVDTWSDTALPLAVEYHLQIARPDANGDAPETASGGSAGTATGMAGGTAGGTASSGGGVAGTATPAGAQAMADPNIVEYSRLVWLPMGKAFSDTGSTMTQQVAPPSSDSDTAGGGQGTQSMGGGQ